MECITYAIIEYWTIIHKGWADITQKCNNKAFFHYMRNSTMLTTGNCDKIRMHIVIHRAPAKMKWKRGCYIDPTDVKR